MLVKFFTDLWKDDSGFFWLLPALAGLGGLWKGAEAAFGENAANARADNANQMQKELTEKNIEMQKEFAQHGIRWRVEDAKAAGLHPLAALGASGASFSPVSAVFDAPERRSPVLDFVSEMGQNLLGSAMRTATRDERASVLGNLQLKAAELDIQHKELQNALLAKDLVGFNSPALPSNSSMPLLTGQGNAFPSSSSGNAYVQEKPLERVHSSPGRPAQEVGTVADFGLARTDTGLTVVPSKDVKERIEDQMIPELMWSARNMISPLTGGMKAPDPKYYPPPKGSTHWVWNPLANEWQGNNYDSYWKRGKEYWNQRPWK